MLLDASGLLIGGWDIQHIYKSIWKGASHLSLSSAQVLSGKGWRQQPFLDASCVLTPLPTWRIGRPSNYQAPLPALNYHCLHPHLRPQNLHALLCAELCFISLFICFVAAAWCLYPHLTLDNHCLYDLNHWSTNGHWMADSMWNKRSSAIILST